MIEEIIFGILRNLSKVSLESLEREGDMVVLIIKFLIGLIALLVGANYLVEGATNLARKFNVSDLVIGLTIVAIGTSTPEMVVSYIGAFKGNSDIAVGNIIGSNICNILLVLGATIAIAPKMVIKGEAKIEQIIMLIVTFLLLIFAQDRLFNSQATNLISRIEGIILLLGFVIFFVFSFKNSTTKSLSHSNSDTVTTENSSSANARSTIKQKYQNNTLVSIVVIIISLGLLIWGGDYMVDNATLIAQAIGLSDAVIATTIVAIGTSAPELATSVIAAIKKNPGIALGNVVGSNIVNITLILGGSAVICPLTLSNIGWTNFAFLIGSAILTCLLTILLKNKPFTRVEGIIFLLCYIVYIFTIL